MSNLLKEILVSELTTSVAEPVALFAEALANELPKLPMGVLFYGSLLRDSDPTGILDFYIITESSADFSGSSLNQYANKILPPNVRYAETTHQGKIYRAKIATLSYEQFLARSSFSTTDTTIWARFCQPVRLLWVRDTHSADKILEAIERCIITASCWAALLGPERAPAEIYWHTLFAHTYKAELRVEKKGRSHNILQGQEARFAECLLAAWKQAHISVEFHSAELQPYITKRNRLKAKKSWNRIERLGRPLNVMRLIKAAFTFENGLSYILWKIERHTGKKIIVSDFEKKHPIICLPLIIWRLRKLRSQT
ncbi:hypothetical protein GT348_04295 [Aristophania vespae]|uniref:Uncharacterized protein n=1 Tax=Aristophania vespae TaxID=2697033 RepID=A0A6P1NDL1_9PROT|nr:hypothetical protein [Aristophania vespae]QHI95588.1 hypothetical protein GT348_04295 [Aristophania vespae]